MSLILKRTFNLRVLSVHSGMVEDSVSSQSLDNAGIIQPYFLVTCAPSMNERKDKTEDMTCLYPTHVGPLAHYPLETTQS